MDGRVLARARAEKENIRRRSIAEDERRHRDAYDIDPALRDLDRQIAALVGEAIRTAESPDGRSLEGIRRESRELQARRAELLAKNGWPPDWLDGAWECPLCRDTGYVDGEMCSCLRRLYDNARVQDLSSLLKLGDQRFDTFDLSWYDDVPDLSGGPSHREHMRRVLKFCRTYAESFGEKSANLLFQGDTGLGKTFLGASIARVVSEKGFSVVYETAAAVFSAYEKRSFRAESRIREDAEEKIRRMLACDLLILDDLGTEMVTDFSRGALYSLVNDRLRSGGRTIITTNLSPADMARIYTPQFCSRLLREYRSLPFVGRDIRQLRKETGL